MNRWLILLLPLIAGIVFFAVYLRKPIPVRVVPGCVNVEEIYKNQPDYEIIQNIRNVGQRTAVGLAVDHVAGTRLFFSDLARSEWRHTTDTLKRRSDHLVRLWSESTSSRLKRKFEMINREMALKDTADFEEAGSRLRSTYNRIQMRKEDDPFVEERFLLMNLRLKLRVLTHDAFVFPEEDLRTIRSKIDSIQRMLDNYDKSVVGEYQRAYDDATRKIRDEYKESVEKRKKEVQAESRVMLEEANSILDLIVDDHEVDINARLEGSWNERKAMLEKFKFLDVSGSIVFEAGKVDELEEEIKKEFERRIRRRAEAVAERNGLSVIIATPYTYAGVCVDVTPEF
ncbi:MAG TPA: hypothetical protein PLN69_02985 [bacterium]|nr:hypothetical protein [bacterium]